jgi:hypothetical protein
VVELTLKRSLCPLAFSTHFHFIIVLIASASEVSWPEIQLQVLKPFPLAFCYVPGALCPSVYVYCGFRLLVPVPSILDIYFIISFAIVLIVVVLFEYKTICINCIDSIRVHTYIYPYVHTHYIHTYIHTYIQHASARRSLLYQHYPGDTVMLMSRYFSRISGDENAPRRKCCNRRI